MAQLPVARPPEPLLSAFVPVAIIMPAQYEAVEDYCTYPTRQKATIAGGGFAATKGSVSASGLDAPSKEA